MKRHKIKELKDKREPGSYLTISRELLGSKSMASLSGKACKLFLNMLGQYNGFNNGDICITWKFMRQLNWRSKQTLYKARAELLQTGLIEISRRGGLNRATLYALTNFAVDDCKKELDILPSRYPKSSWKKNECQDPIKKLQVPLSG